MIFYLQEFLVNQELNIQLATLVSIIIAIIGLLITALFFNKLGRQHGLKLISRIALKSNNQWDDILLKRKVFNRFSHFIPAMVIYISTPFVFTGHQQLISVITSITNIYMVIIVALTIGAILNAVLDIYRTHPVAKEIPIKGFMQVIKLIIYFISGVLVFSILLNKSPLYLISGFGALTAVLMLVFKDTLLGFVAGIQLTANRMIANGDWIEMPKFGADGEVLDVTLTTVKVRNWDNTVSTIPTYSLMTGSFKNWRGMSESDGRRIKRSIHIDINSIEFCTAEMLDRFSKINHLKDYMKNKLSEINADNQLESFKETVSSTHQNFNTRQLTNIGCFRAYVLHYLKNHPMINQQLTLLVRQLAPTQNGLPIEIYVFSTDKVWVNYEAIQADIFDHLLAVLHEFELNVFQNPGGRDFAKISVP
jgi:miniconductance mechanosensitive channel